MAKIGIKTWHVLLIGGVAAVLLIIKHTKPLVQSPSDKPKDKGLVVWPTIKVEALKTFWHRLWTPVRKW